MRVKLYNKNVQNNMHYLLSIIGYFNFVWLCSIFVTFYDAIMWSRLKIFGNPAKQDNFNGNSPWSSNSLYHTPVGLSLGMLYQFQYSLLSQPFIIYCGMRCTICNSLLQIWKYHFWNSLSKFMRPTGGISWSNFVFRVPNLTYILSFHANFCKFVGLENFNISR